MFVSHARTPEELKSEVISDLQRRLNYLDGYTNVVAQSKTEKAQLATAKRELEDMLRFWTELTIIRPKRVRKDKEKLGETWEEYQARTGAPS